MRRKDFSGSLGILPAAFNPPTIAHLALAEAGLQHVDEVLFVLPREFPHKTFEGASLPERVEMTRRVIEPEPRFSLAIADRGLFADIARESRQVFGQVPLSFLCGRDAAERIVTWDYGEPGAFERMLREFSLLVASRQGDFEVPEQFRNAIRCLTMNSLDEVSSSEVRRRIAAREAWQDLVPAAIREQVEKIYRNQR